PAPYRSQNSRSSSPSSPPTPRRWCALPRPVRPTLRLPAGAQSRGCSRGSNAWALAIAHAVFEITSSLCLASHHCVDLCEHFVGGGDHAAGPAAQFHRTLALDGQFYVVDHL